MCLLLYLVLFGWREVLAILIFSMFLSSYVLSEGKAFTLQGTTLIEELEDAILKNQRTPITYSELAAIREGRFNASIQHRLAELEG